jgi:hypothetical protein
MGLRMRSETECETALDRCNRLLHSYRRRTNRIRSSNHTRLRGHRQPSCRRKSLWRRRWGPRSETGREAGEEETDRSCGVVAVRRPNDPDEQTTPKTMTSATTTNNTAATMISTIQYCFLLLLETTTEVVAGRTVGAVSWMVGTTFTIMVETVAAPGAAAKHYNDRVATPTDPATVDIKRMASGKAWVWLCSFEIFRR